MSKDAVLAKAGGMLALARGTVRKKAPYLSTTLHGLIPQPVWDPRVTLAVTAKLVLYYNPAWLAEDPELNGKEGKEVMAGCLYHECWHPIHGIPRLEALVGRGRSSGLSLEAARRLANIASDLAINNAARDAGWKLPSWVYYPERYGLKGGMITEEYWAELLNNQDTLKDIEGEEGGSIGAGWCGGIAGGCFEDIEAALDQEIGRSDSDVKRIQQTTVQDMQSHVSAGRGSIPGFSDADIKFVKQRPLVRWERKLNHVLTKCSGLIVSGDTDYTMLRPDKNSALLGVCLPSTIDQEPEICFIRDTSMSMGEAELNHANNEVIHAMKALGVDTVWLLDADTQTHGKPRRVSVRDIPRIKVRGRGGTDFHQPLAAAAKLFPRPDIVIYMTDGDGNAPNKKPREFEVIWCVVPSTWGQAKPASWGHLIFCSNKRSEVEAFEA